MCLRQLMTGGGDTGWRCMITVTYATSCSWRQLTIDHIIVDCSYSEQVWWCIQSVLRPEGNTLDGVVQLQGLVEHLERAMDGTVQLHKRG